jgi:hypothetical protein
MPFSTTIIIPFNISSNEEDIISENSLKDTVFYEELRQYLFRISNNKNSIIDKFKYHTYISNYLGSNENKVNDLSFLETFFIDPEKVNKIIKDKIPFNFFFNRINLKLGKSNLHFGLNEPLIILNKKIKIGYVIFRFRFIESSDDNDKTYPSDEESLAFVEALSKIDFFRFIFLGNGIIRKNEYLIKVVVCGDPWESFLIGKFFQMIIRPKPKLQLQVHADISDNKWRSGNLANLLRSILQRYTFNHCDQIRVVSRNLQVYINSISQNKNIVNVPIPILIPQKKIKKSQESFD